MGDGRGEEMRRERGIGEWKGTWDEGCEGGRGGGERKDGGVEKRSDMGGGRKAKEREEGRVCACRVCGGGAARFISSRAGGNLLYLKVGNSI